jgi:hypothetical protein
MVNGNKESEKLCQILEEILGKIAIIKVMSSGSHPHSLVRLLKNPDESIIEGDSDCYKF